MELVDGEEIRHKRKVSAFEIGKTASTKTKSWSRETAFARPKPILNKIYKKWTEKALQCFVSTLLKVATEGMSPFARDLRNKVNLDAIFIPIYQENFKPII